MVTTLWFCLAAATITGYVLLDGFDLGAGIMQVVVTRTEGESTHVLLRSIGPCGMAMRFGCWLSGPRCFYVPGPVCICVQRLLSLVNDSALVVDLAWNLNRI
jgi:hypothetical protein